ncbi:MAG: hypothetical protein GX287_00075 [Fusobacteria bacterium]|nr:hypothetical protein [Fusobacteriota bacterium]
MKFIKIIFLILLLITIFTGCMDKLYSYNIYFDQNPEINILSKVYDKEIEMASIGKMYKSNDKYVVAIKLYGNYDKKLYDTDCFYVSGGNLYRGSIKEETDEGKPIYFYTKIKGYNSYTEYGIDKLKVKSEKLKKIFKKEDEK